MRASRRGTPGVTSPRRWERMAGREGSPRPRSPLSRHRLLSCCLFWVWICPVKTPRSQGSRGSCHVMCLPLEEARVSLGGRRVNYAGERGLGGWGRGNGRS